MALYDRLMDDLRLSLPGATDPGIQRSLWRTINTACRDGWIWRDTFGVTPVAGETEYDASVSAADVVQVLSIAHETLDVSDATVDGGTLYLSTVPDAADTASDIVMIMVLAPLATPTDPNDWLPEDMWLQYHDLWLHGTLAHMMAQPAKPYSNVNLALFYGRSFKRDLNQAKLKVRTGAVPGAQLWQFPRWA